MVSKQVTQQILDFIQFVFTTFRRLACPPNFRHHTILTAYKLNVVPFNALHTYREGDPSCAKCIPPLGLLGLAVCCVHSSLNHSHPELNCLWRDLLCISSFHEMPLHVDGFSKCLCSGTALRESSLFTKIQVTFHLIQATVFLRSVTSLVQTERKDLVGSSF